MGPRCPHQQMMAHLMGALDLDKTDAHCTPLMMGVVSLCMLCYLDIAIVLDPTALLGGVRPPDHR